MRKNINFILSQTIDGYSSTNPIDGYADSANFNTAPIFMATSYGLSTQVAWTGSPSGSVKMQGSNDLEVVSGVPDAKIVNWADVPSATANFSTGSPIIFDVSSTSVRWMRLVFTNSGSATFSARVQIKSMMD